ncbi:MAG: hypothetical protein IJD79_07960 [Clostridia bacterium]|nr:hypothetical protein [Clostridia bacterium]
MKKIILFLILSLALAALTACDTLFENLGITDPSGTGDGDGTNTDNGNKDNNGGDITDNGHYITVTLSEFDGNGKPVTREEKIDLNVFAEFGGYDKWLESNVTEWDIYRYRTCYDITVNGEPMPDGYSIKAGDVIVLREREPEYVVSINMTTYDGGKSFVSYRLSEPIRLGYLFELLVDDSGRYAHHIDYFYQAYSITAGGVAFSTDAELSQDITIDIHKKAPSFRVTVIDPEEGACEFDMYTPTDVYTTLFEYMWNGGRVELFDHYKLYFGDAVITNTEDAKKYTVDASHSLLVFKTADATDFKIDINNSYQINALATIPCDLDALFKEYLGMSYGEVTEIFTLECEGKIVDGILHGCSYVVLKLKEDRDACEVKLDVYDGYGNYLYSESTTVPFGTPLSEARFGEFNPDSAASYAFVYLDGKLLTAADLTKLITRDITLEKKPPKPEVEEDERPTVTVWFEEGGIDTDNPKYEFLKQYLDFGHEAMGAVKDYAFDTAITFNEALVEIIGYDYRELMKKGIFAEAYSYKSNNILSPDEEFTGECMISFYGGKTIELKVYREVDGVRYGSYTALAHSAMRLVDFMKHSEYLSGGAFSESLFTNRLPASDSGMIFPPNLYGRTMEDFADNFDDLHNELETITGTMIIRNYEPFKVDFYHNDEFIKSETYTHAVKVIDLFPEVPGYTEKSCCHVNRYIYTGEGFHMYYIMQDTTIVIYDEYTPGAEEEKDGLA